MILEVRRSIFCLRLLNDPDLTEWGPPFVGGESAYFLGLNRNKRSIAVNIQTQKGIDIIRQLAVKSDVLVSH